MDGSGRRSRDPNTMSVSPLKQRRSGYEPSDTEADWQDSPWWEHGQSNGVPKPDALMAGADAEILRNTSPLRMSRRFASRVDNNGPPPPRKASEAISVRRRHSSKSPYKPRRDDGNALSPKHITVSHRNVSPLPKLEHRRKLSPYKQDREDNDQDSTNNRKQRHRTPPNNRDEGAGYLPFVDVSKVSVRSNYSQRSATAPRSRIAGGRVQTASSAQQAEEMYTRTPSPLSRNTTREVSPFKKPSVGEINEIVANLKARRAPIYNAPNFESTDSFSQGDIFFSRDHTALAMQQTAFKKNNGSDSRFSQIPKPIPPVDIDSQQRVNMNETYGHSSKGSSYNAPSGPRLWANSSSSVSRQSSGKLSTTSSKMTDSSGRTTESMTKFTENRRKSQTEPWFACMRKGSCRTSKPAETKGFDETSYIEKMFVVEHLRQFWADKYQPASLDGFSCHKQEAQLLKQLVSEAACPHILFKGPPGSGKRSLTMAVLREIYGDQSSNVSHELRHFQIQEKRQMQIAIPLTSSAHHVELNVHLEPNSRYALMSLVKEISNNHAIIPEVSAANFKADYKVIVLYEVDKAAEVIQHLIKWIIDCYSDACKLILCCEDDSGILEPVKSRCKVITLNAPIAHEIMEILIQIGREEDFELSMNFAAKIATKSKQNIRRAIMALEACKAHNYPFADDQPIPVGWEEVLAELASDILADPSQKRLFFVRGKIQKLLVDYVHPKLILQKLVEQFLKGVESGSRRELFYWHAYYEKRLPTGTAALLKLEEFVAKFMGIHRKSSGINRYAI